MWEPPLEESHPSGATKARRPWKPLLTSSPGLEAGIGTVLERVEWRWNKEAWSRAMELL